MSMPQQLTQIPIGRIGNPDSRKPVLCQQPVQESSILAISHLSADARSLDLRRVSDPELETQFRHEPFEPARMSGGLDPHSHGGSLLLQIAVEFFRFSRTVLQYPFQILSTFCVNARNVLLARVIIASYNPHVGSFLPSLGLDSATKFTRSTGAGIVMESIVMPAQGLTMTESRS